jgi:thiazole synthase
MKDMSASQPDGAIEIRLNGKPHMATAEQTISQLLEQLGLDPRVLVVEMNRQIIRRTELGEIRLEAGDVIELVHFVGGG